MAKTREQGGEERHPALPLQLPQPISLHILFSNTVSYILCDRTCRWTSSEFWYLQKLSTLSKLQTSRETEFIFQQAKHGPQSLQSIAKGIISSTIWKQSQLVLNSLCKFCLLKVLVKLYFCVHLKSIKVSAVVKGDDFVLPSPVHLFCPCFLSL